MVVVMGGWTMILRQKTLERRTLEPLGLQENDGPLTRCHERDAMREVKPRLTSSYK